MGRQVGIGWTFMVGHLWAGGEERLDIYGRQVGKKGRVGRWE